MNAGGEGFGGDYLPEVERENAGGPDVDGDGVVALSICGRCRELVLISVGMAGLGAQAREEPASTHHRPFLFTGLDLQNNKGRRDEDGSTRLACPQRACRDSLGLNGSECPSLTWA